MLRKPSAECPAGAFLKPWIYAQSENPNSNQKRQILTKIEHQQHKALGYSLTALIYISMDMHTPERFEHFDREIGVIPEVVECLLITGQEADYQLKVVARDMDAFQELLLNRITRIQGVTGVHSSFVLRRVLDRTEVPV